MNAEFTEPLDECIDNAIQSCPMDYRRKLYNNIVLSGGSTLFDGFDKKLKKLVQTRVDARLNAYREMSGHQST